MSELEARRVMPGYTSCWSCGRIRLDSNLTTTRVDAPGSLFCQPDCTGPRELREIAAEIRSDWPIPHEWAAPYLDAMDHLGKITDMYGHDDAEGIVLRFLLNARSYRGETARRIKAELKGMLKK